MIRVFVFEASALARKALDVGLGADPMIEVVGSASTPGTALARIKRLQPDVLVLNLDLDREGTDGLGFLSTLMGEAPTRTVALTAQGQRGSPTSLAALNAGAASVLAKPSAAGAPGIDAPLLKELAERVKQAATAGPPRAPSLRPAKASTIPSPRLSSVPSLAPHVIGLGMSTGGVQAMATMLPLFPADAPPIVMVDHMPGGYSAAYAERLDRLCAMRVREAADGDPLEAGLVLIAPGGDRHMLVTRERGRLRVRLSSGELVTGHRPSVDALFHSLARLDRTRVAAALMTGMGRDGAEGLLALRRAGAQTFAQDEATSVVYGMPKAAVELGAAHAHVPLESLPQRLLAG